MYHKQNGKNEQDQLLKVVEHKKEKTMPLTRLKQHDQHEVSIHLVENPRSHYAALRCQQCNTHIQWLDRSTTHQLIDWGVTVKKKYTPSNIKRIRVDDLL